MAEAGQAQRVVLIQDASRSISSSAIKWAIDGLSLKPGDELTLLGVLHQVNTPSTFPFIGAGKFSKTASFSVGKKDHKGSNAGEMGYKSRLDSSSIFGANQKVIDDEVMRKELEFQNSIELLEISKLYEVNKIAFHKRIVATSSPKGAAVEAVKRMGATWIILCRQMKKDKKYFMEKLSCGISRMKRNNSVELLRGPKAVRSDGENSKANKSEHVRNNEILPGQAAKLGKSAVLHETFDDDDDLFSLDIFPSNLKNSYNSSSDERGIDSEQGVSGADSATTSFFPSTSYEVQSSLSAISTSPETIEDPFGLNNNMSESSSLQEHKYASNQKELQDNDSKIECIEGSNIVIEETGQKQINLDDEILNYEFTNKRLEERIENSACSECKSEHTKAEFRNDFTYAELHSATDGFSMQNYVSEGGFGSVYKGILKGGQRIAVKIHKHASSQGEKEFRSEVNVLSKARHRNVVTLLGSCSERNHRLLVYEYICNGSLNMHLEKSNPKVLSWKNRMNIALGVARGLNYLHQENIIHRDMRPNNILINHDYEPLLGDFGLAKVHQDGSDSLNKVVGTVGYLAPEYAKKGRVSTKTDVYSFGVVLLELITGRTTMDKRLARNSLVGWARPLLKEKKYPELIDERILNCHDVHELFWMVRVAEMCLHRDPDKRLSMDKVEAALKCIVDGETVTGFEDYSPTHSSDSSFQRSNDSDREYERELHDSDSKELPSTGNKIQSTETTPASAEQSSTKSVSASTKITETVPMPADQPPARSLGASTKTNETVPSPVEQPPTRSLGASIKAEGSKSGIRRSYTKKEKVTYDEMLD